VPSPEANNRYQDAVLWPISGTDRYGEQTRGTRVQLRVRWNATHREMLDAQGNRIAIEAEAVVDRVVANGSVMWLGTIAQWDATGVTSTNSELMEVVSYEETKDVKGRYTERVVNLRRFRNTLPESA
jgi:hypothetical protein